jgi:hypothetical protein
MRLAVFLTKRERKSLNAGTKEFDLKSAVSYLTLLPDELIKKTGSRTSSVPSGGGVNQLRNRHRARCRPILRFPP